MEMIDRKTPRGPSHMGPLYFCEEKLTEAPLGPCSGEKFPPASSRGKRKGAILKYASFISKATKV